MRIPACVVMMAILMTGTAAAFDPVGPPPEKTMAWTVGSIARLIVPSIDFRGESVEDAAVFLMQFDGAPKNYRASIDTSTLGKDAQRKLSLQARDKTLLHILGAMAQEIDADLLIAPGKVSFVPRGHED